MKLSDIEFKLEYRTKNNDITKEFYEPALGVAILYQRAVGYFSSSALVAISKGLDKLVENGGKIQVIASPKLSSDDIEKIKKGYEIRDVVEKSLFREINNNEGDKESLSYVTKLIANSVMDIKIAFLKSENMKAMYHEKMGIISDAYGNMIAFSGSMNETLFGYEENYEAIDVFCSWKNDTERVNQKKLAFMAIWGDYEKDIITIPFPKAIKEKMLRMYCENDGCFERKNTKKLKTSIQPDIFIPKDISLRYYQKKAITSWKSQGYRGIFDMATGTGKTITALACLEKLYRENSKRLAVIIVCPYQHLVEQWCEDIKKFGMQPIIGYSSSLQRKWKERLKVSINLFISREKNHFCFVTTMDTMITKNIRDCILKLDTDTVLVIDEVHNVGSRKRCKCMIKNIPYRLGLSATIDRWYDDEGTKKIIEYFGDRCITYTLKDAIDNKMLTPYYYYPVVVSLTEKELDKYLEISNKISKLMVAEKKDMISEAVKKLLIKRSRLVAGAINKIGMLERSIKKYSKDNHILVYCGSSKLINDDECQCDEDYKDGIEQIKVVADLLGNKMNMRVGRFTAKENAEERMKIREMFEEGKQLQALVAIRCLDEGVNIPSIDKVFILASSTNPKEYIQRRGRVLRKYPGKIYAIIYDFITLPVPIDKIELNHNGRDVGLKSLVRNELRRIKEFKELAINPSDANEVFLKIKHEYGLKNDEIMDGDKYAI